MSTATAPGFEVTVRAESAPSDESVDTGRWFVAGITERGPTEPREVRGWNGYRRLFGGRTHQTTLADPARLFFELGGGSLVVARAVGPAAERASVTLQDGDSTPDDTIEVTAKWPGAAYNDLEVEVIEHSDDTVTLRVVDDGDVRETYRRMATVDDIVAEINQRSDLVQAEDLASDSGDPLPAEGTFDLSGGSDDVENITDTEVHEALGLVGADWGPGQVSLPGRHDSADWDALISHAEDRNRIAVLDVDPDVDAAAVAAEIESVDSWRAAIPVTEVVADVGDRHARVPGSAALAARIAAVDQRWPTAHVPAAGKRGQLRAPGVDPGVVIETTQRYTADQHAEINAAGGIVFVNDRRRGIRIEGFRTASTDPAWEQLSQARYVMGLWARAEQVADGFLFDVISRQRLADYADDLQSLLDDDEAAGAITDGSVDTGEDVNPPEQIADGEIDAEIEFTVRPFGERGRIVLIKRS